jgi:hypothetical protein|tara:strand:+ start:2469 stop:2669 length:201 start_codon:yes stop_codon:yes gene_type:complete
MKKLILILAFVQGSMCMAQEHTEEIILIEDMIEWIEWDIEEGRIEKVRGGLLILNLIELKSKLEEQ